MLCRRSPSQAWVHLVPKPPLASQLLHSAQQVTGTSRTLGKSNIQTTGDAAAPCLWPAKCLQRCHSTATEGENTWSVPPCTEKKSLGEWDVALESNGHLEACVSSILRGGESGESPSCPQVHESCIACDSMLPALLSEAGGTGKYLL